MELFLTDMFLAFSYIATSSFDRISPGIKLRRKRPLANFVSESYVGCVSLTVPKHLDSCSNFHKAKVTSRALPSPVFTAFCILPRPIHLSWNQGLQ